MQNYELHTIGYEGSTIEAVVAKLRDAGIDLLIDVRELPLSRKRGFSKSALRQGLAEEGIDYLHLKGLGDPKAGRVAAREGRVSDFHRIFNAHLKTTPAMEDLERGIEAARSNCACLMCFERDHSDCHRHIVAKEMARREGFRLIHLEVADDSAARKVSQGKSRRSESTSLIGQC